LGAPATTGAPVDADLAGAILLPLSSPLPAGVCTTGAAKKAHPAMNNARLINTIVKMRR
jgi:hypothetical protein